MDEKKDKVPWFIQARLDAQAALEDEVAQKRAFARALLFHPTDPYKAAIMVLGFENTGKALQIHLTWPLDQIVLQEQVRLIYEEGEETFLPSKLAVARRIFELAEGEHVPAKDRLAAYRLYAEMMEMVPRPSAIGVGHLTVNQQNNRVLVMKDHGTDDEHEQHTMRQQAKLIEAAREDNNE